MVLPPQHSNNRNSSDDANIVADRKEEDTAPGRREHDRSNHVAPRPYHRVFAILKNVAAVVGVLAIILIILAAISDPETVTNQPQNPKAAELFVPQNQTETATIVDDWTPQMLCEDEQILESLVAVRRQWLKVLLQDMAADGSYILPATGDPIGEGVARASIAFPEGTEALGLSDTGGDESADAVLVHCSGTVEIRDAFKLPDNNWSAAFLIFNDARFDIRAGSERFTLELPNIDQELSTGIINIAGAQMRLQALREMSSGTQ